MEKISDMEIKFKLIERDWEDYSNFLESLDDQNIYVGLSKLCKKKKLTKNTVKTRLHYVKQGKVAYFNRYFRHGNSVSNRYPYELQLRITERYIAACNERALLTSDARNKITFKYFFDEYDQKYEVGGKTYYPKLTYVQQSIKNFGFYSKLCTHYTKRSLSHKKNFVDKFVQENKDFLNMIGEDEFVKSVSKIKTDKITKIKPKQSYQSGAFMEIDSSNECWIGSEKFDIGIAVDATGYLLNAVFSRTETNAMYIKLISGVFRYYGMPKLCITDQRVGLDGRTAGQMRREIEKVGSRVESSSNPNAKPKVERSFRTFENDFAYFFFKNRNIKTLEEAKGLEREFVLEYNKKYKKKLTEETLFTELQPDEIDSMKVEYNLRVKSDYTIDIFGEDYDICDENGNKILIKPGPTKIIFDGSENVNPFFKLGYRKYWLLPHNPERKSSIPDKRTLKKIQEHLFSDMPASKKEVNALVKIINHFIDQLNYN